MAQSAQQAVGAAGDQFYVTHCTTADSVLNNPGYTVRAASADDPDTLASAVRYPPYELPIDMWRDLPQPAATPRRLARTDNPDGGIWVVYSTYLAKDTVGRDRSYFSHLYLVRSADPAAVLRSWGAAGWVKEYPSGADKKLPGNARLPVGTLVSDESLTAFLGNQPTGPADLANTVCPPRLRNLAAAERRDFFARFLQAMLILDAEERDQRRRLYIHAEPGVIALMLYGAVRLLPPNVTNDFTFSTFEPYHRNIRDYKLADVVGTYLGAPDKGLEADLGTTRGIALDTFVPARSSPELRPPVREILTGGVSDLIDLAARGQWALLPTVRRVMGPDADGLARAGKAITRARGLAKVEEGRASIDDLLAIQDDASGAEELVERAGTVWPVVKEAALDPNRADVRRAFRDFISDPERVKEVWEEAVDAILKEDYRKWDARWALLREVPGREEAKKLLRKLVGSEKNEDRLSRLPTDIRARMRAACKEVELVPPRPLLVPIGLGELEPLITAQPDWAGYTAFVLLADEKLDKVHKLSHVPAPDRTQMRERARRYLFSAPGPAIAAYVHAARPYLDTDPAFLAILFKPYSQTATALMDRLLTTTTLEPGDWMKLCAHVGLTQDKWGEFLLEKDRLANLLVGLGGEGIGKEVWGAYLGLLTHALVSPELISTEDGTEPEVVHAWERKVHNHLKVAAEKLTAAGARLALALPEGGVARLFAANNLLKWVDKPASAERDGHEEVQHACDTFGIDRLDLVRVAYKKGEYDGLELPEQNAKLEPLATLFRTCFPVDAQYHTARSAVTQWLKLSEECPAASRAAFQAYFVLQCVPTVHYSNLLGETRQQKFEPRAEAAIRQAMTTPVKNVAKNATKKSPGRAGARSTAPEATFEDEDGPIAEEVSVGDGELPTPDLNEPAPSAKRKGARGGKSSRGSGRKKQDNTNLYVFGAVGVGVLAVFIVIVIAMNSNSKKETPDPTPKDAKPVEQKPEQKPPTEPPKEKKDKDKKENPKKEKDKEKAGLLEPGADPGLAMRAGADVIGFASGLAEPVAEPLPPPTSKWARAGEEVFGFVNELIPPRAAEPPKSDPRIGRAGAEAFDFASGLVARHDSEAFENLGKALPELSRKLPRLRFWN